MRIRDCSSDVCSSDLSRFAAASGQGYRDRLMATALCNARVLLTLGLRDDICVVIEGARIRAVSSSPPADAEIVALGGKQIGRATCRERVCQTVSIEEVSVQLNKTTTNTQHRPT